MIRINTLKAKLWWIILTLALLFLSQAMVMFFFGQTIIGVMLVSVGSFLLTAVVAAYFFAIVWRRIRLNPSNPSNALILLGVVAIVGLIASIVVSMLVAILIAPTVPMFQI